MWSVFRLEDCVAALCREYVLYSGYVTEAAVAAQPKVQSGSPLDKASKEPRGQVTEEFIDEQLRRLDRQVQIWGRVDQEQVHELLQLVKRAG